MKILSEFLSDWRTVGAIAPTSRFAQRAMLDVVEWQAVRLAVELGPGAGNITRSILARLRPDARLLAVEINERFVTEISRNVVDERLAVVHGSAVDLDEILSQDIFKGPQADVIISAIPFTSLTPSVRDAICQAVARALRDGGRLVALQYTPFVLPRLLARYFGPYTVRRCWLNLPPALIYTCTRGLRPITMLSSCAAD